MRIDIGEAYEASTTPTSALQAAKGQRLSLRRAIDDFQAALEAPAGAADLERLVSVLDHLRVVFAVHVEVTESSGGLYEEIMEIAPRLANKITRFKREHVAITGAIGSALDDLREHVAITGAIGSALDDLREDDVPRGLPGRLTPLLETLARHRKRGADLVYEAYHVDIGGES